MWGRSFAADSQRQDSSEESNVNHPHSYRDDMAADLMRRLEREAQQQDSITVQYLLREAIACIGAMRDIINAPTATDCEGKP